MNAMVALDRCRRAWERTSPQLVIDGWLDMLDGLDEARGGARPVEPAAVAALLGVSPDGGLESRLAAEVPVAVSRHDTEGCYPLPDSQSSVGLSGRKDEGSHSDGLAPSPDTSAASRDRLNNGAEPCCGTPEELTAVVPAAADTASPVSSAPSQHYGGCRISPEESRGSRQRGV